MARPRSTALRESAGSIKSRAHMDAGAAGVTVGRTVRRGRDRWLFASTHHPVQTIPQVVAVAIALRHSWHMEDFYRIVRRLNLINMLTLSNEAAGDHHE